MLKRVEIKSFKSLLDVNVELGVVNVFIGANGSGKSNLLEAIGILGAAASGRVDDEGIARQVVDMLERKRQVIPHSAGVTLQRGCRSSIS